MNDDAIPLSTDGSSGATIQPERSTGGTETHALRSRRTNPRRECENVHVCFSPQTQTGLPDNVECPLLNISASGMAIEYDRPLKKGVSAYVSYYSISRVPINIGCVVQHCDLQTSGHYIIGLRTNRPLKYEERKPMRVGAGRVVSPHVRARKLRPPPSPTPPMS
ncbi:MAG TPA: PilZ domain-containing protein [Phycisphaerae bacterium]|nr:PilZ domain-containing protein [Phycisphaerae bacterium]